MEESLSTPERIPSTDRESNNKRALNRIYRSPDTSIHTAQNRTKSMERFITSSSTSFNTPRLTKRGRSNKSGAMSGGSGAIMRKSAQKYKNFVTKCSGDEMADIVKIGDPNIPLQKTVYVCCRIKPITPTEVKRRENCLQFNCNKKEIVLYDQEYYYFPKQLTYYFDEVFAPTQTQEEIYISQVKSKVSAAFNGYNGSMLVYGSKHSSKTYTMFGEWPNINNTQTQGVAPRVFQDCFRRARASKDNVTTVIKMQMIEIYYLKGVEKIRDLLNPDAKITLRESTSRELIIENMGIYPINDAREGINKLRVGMKKANKTDIQGHIMIIISITQTNTTTGCIKSGKIGLVKMGHNEVSKLSLTRILFALNDAAGHVPYRDTKFTRLLQDIIGGNCVTTIMLTANPTQKMIRNTISVLGIVNPAQKVKNVPIQSREVTYDEMMRIGSEQYIKIQRLEQLIKELGCEIPSENLLLDPKFSIKEWAEECKPRAKEHKNIYIQTEIKKVEKRISQTIGDERAEIVYKDIGLQCGDVDVVDIDIQTGCALGDMRECGIVTTKLESKEKRVQVGGSILHDIGTQIEDVGKVHQGVQCDLEVIQPILHNPPSQVLSTKGYEESGFQTTNVQYAQSGVQTLQLEVIQVGTQEGDGRGYNIYPHDIRDGTQLYSVLRNTSHAQIIHFMHTLSYHETVNLVGEMLNEIKDLRIRNVQRSMLGSYYQKKVMNMRLAIRKITTLILTLSEIFKEEHEKQGEDEGILETKLKLLLRELEKAVHGRNELLTNIMNMKSVAKDIQTAIIDSKYIKIEKTKQKMQLSVSVRKGGQDPSEESKESHKFVLETEKELVVAEKEVVKELHIDETKDNLMNDLEIKMKELMKLDHEEYTDKMEYKNEATKRFEKEIDGLMQQIKILYITIMEQKSKLKTLRDEKSENQESKIENTIHQFEEDRKIMFTKSTLIEQYEELLDAFANQFKPPGQKEAVVFHMEEGRQLHIADVDVDEEEEEKGAGKENLEDGDEKQQF